MRTARISGRSLAPRQAGHATSRVYPKRRSFCVWDSEVSIFRFMYPSTPSNGADQFRTRPYRFL